MRRARLPHGGRRAGGITSAVLRGSGRGRGREEKERGESAWAAAPRLPAPGEGKHAPAHAPLRAPKITRARQRPPPRAASPQAPRSATRPGSRAGSRRGARDTCAHSVRGAGDTRRRGARGSRLRPGPSLSPLGAQPRPGAASDGPRAHRDLPAAIASRASRRPLQAEGTRLGSGHGRCGCGRSPRPAQPGARHRRLSVTRRRPEGDSQRARRPRAGRRSRGCGLGCCASRPAPAPSLGGTRSLPTLLPTGLPQWSKPISHTETNPFACPWTAKLNGHDASCQDLW